MMMLLAQHEAPAHAAVTAVAKAVAMPDLRWAGWILLLPAISVVLTGLCAALRVKNKLPGWITVLALAGSFALVLKLYFLRGEAGDPVTIHLWDWMNFRWGDQSKWHSLQADVSIYLDGLTLFWMLFVTGLGTLIALYATEYMEADVGKGYARFFNGVSIFILAMCTLVLADNLLLLYLGWEGVGLASYLLIGYFYKKPSAVAAGKKAFIVNRVGDLGLAVGIWLIWVNYGSIEYSTLFQVWNDTARGVGGFDRALIPFCLMLGAFGKSAQLPLYVWLPDAMEGPTPVSALIHAATMVTAGVYLIARMYPLFALHPDALATVAWVGGLTAIFSATIGMAQYDFKRVFAYSTISQLGYMFMGLGVGTTFGAAYHTLTHAFFKALLFLTAGAVMHGFAGQLDLRKLSGLRRVPGFAIVSWTMLIGCLWLSAFPFTAGMLSKDLILVQAIGGTDHGFFWLGWIGLITAALTAYYSFRVWFRVCAGPVFYMPGDEGHDDHDNHDDHHHGAHDKHASHEFHPHAPRLAINGVLILIMLGAFATGIPGYMALQGHENWAQVMIAHSSAVAGSVEAHVHDAVCFGMNPHKLVEVFGTIAALGGIGVAMYFHLLQRRAADRLRAWLLAHNSVRWIPVAMENKWYVDEIYHALFRGPAWITGHILHFTDKHVVDGLLVNGFGRIPAAFGRLFQPLYNGVLQGYATTMAGGAALVIAWIVYRWISGGAT
ncbi:MAG: NADH-quinone oxidoreductase subunit L [Planctomycetes bacterium]|nr:NADH-quinone oxidoreductase subunit L [Planctomycetota bacterium]